MGCSPPRALVEQVTADGGPLLLLTFHDLLPDSARAAFAGLVQEVLLRAFDAMAAADDTRFLGTLFGFLDPSPQRPRLQIR